VGAELFANVRWPNCGHGAATPQRASDGKDFAREAADGRAQDERARGNRWIAAMQGGSLVVALLGSSFRQLRLRTN